MDTFNVLKSAETPTLEIDVTQDDIDNGIPHSFSNCAIARAVRRRTGIKDIGVSRVVFVNLTEWQLPVGAIDFIRRFDNNEPVVPQKFKLTFVRDDVRKDP